MLTYGNRAGCPFRLEAYRTAGDGVQRAHLPSTEFGCAEDLTELTIPAQDSVVYELQVGVKTEFHTAPRGDYVLRAVLPDPLKPLEEPFVVESPLGITLELSAQSVAAGDSLTAAVLITNHSDDDITLQMFGCGVHFRVFTESEDGLRRVEMNGANYGCLTGNWELPVPAHGSYRIENVIEAQIGEDPVTAGEYLLRADFENRPGIGTIESPLAVN